MSIDALLIEVREDTRGSQTLAPVPAGSTQIPVDDITDFPDEGGQIDVAGTLLDYVAVTLVDAGMEPDPVGEPGDGMVPLMSGILTLADPLTVALAEDDPVLLIIGSEPATDAYGILDVATGEDNAIDGGDTVQVPIEYDQRPMFPVGPYEPPVAVQVAGDLSRIITVPGVRPTIDATSIINLPEPGEPTEPPETSPLPVVVGNIRIILGSLAPVPLATAYDIFLSDNPAASPSSPYLVGTATGSQFQITGVPDALIPPDSVEESLRAGTDYWVALVARNTVGAADPSPWVGPVQLRQVSNEEISAEFAYLGDVLADQIRAGTLSAVVTLSGKFTTRSGDLYEPGGELDSDGLRGFGLPSAAGEPAPLEVRIPFTGDPNDEAYFAGKVAARKLTTYEGAEFHGFVDGRGEPVNRVKEDGAFFLEAGTGSPPAAPQVTQIVPSNELERTVYEVPDLAATFDASQCRGFAWDPVHEQFITAQAGRGGWVFWGISKLGEVRRQWGILGISTTTAYVRKGQTPHAILYTSSTGQTRLETWSVGIPSTMIGRAVIDRANANQIPALGLGSDGDLRVAELIPNSGGQLRIQRYTFPASGNPVWVNNRFTVAGIWGTAALGVVHYGGFDFGATRWVFVPRNGTGVTVTQDPGGSLTRDANLEWTGPVGMVGVSMDAIPGQPGTGWWGLGTDNRLYMFGSNTWPNSVTSRHVAAITMATDTAESQISDQAAFTLNKRWQATITAPNLITPATRAGIYLWRGASGFPSSAQQVRQGFTTAGSRTFTLPPTGPLYSGPAPGAAPTDGAWPEGSPARLLSEAADLTGPLIRLEGDGDWRLGYLGSGPDRGPVQLQSGGPILVATALAQYATADATITYPRRFAAPPAVSFNAAGTWGPLFMVVSNTATAVTVRVANLRNAAVNMNITWDAIGQLA